MALVVVPLLLAEISVAQNVGINETGADPDNSAILDVDSKTKGLLIPRLKKADRLAIIKPANGLLIYQTDDTIGFWYYDQMVWKPVFQNITTGKGLTGGTLKAYGTIQMAPTSVSPGQYGHPDSIPQFTVNNLGQLIFARNVPVKERDSVIGNELSDTINTYGMMTRTGSGSSVDPYKVGMLPGSSPGDVWMWDGTKWISASISFPVFREKDSVIGNEISDTLLSRGVLLKSGSGTSVDPYKIGVQPGLNVGDVWMWNGSSWVSGSIVYPTLTEKDSVVGNEVRDTLNAHGILTKFGSGTAADPLTMGINPGINPGDIWMWDGTKWIATKFTIPSEQDSVIGNEVQDTINARGILNLYGTGTTADPLKVGIEPGKNIGEVWTWDGNKWISAPVIHPSVNIPKEKDSIIGNEIADTMNTYGMMRLYGSGTDADPFKIGMTPGTSAGQYWAWDGKTWVLSTIAFPKFAERDSVVGNEISDTINSRGILTLKGSGSSANPLKVGVNSGNSSGDVWMWNGKKWVPTQITHPSEIDGVIGNEIQDTINSRGILNRTGTGTAASPYKVSINPGNSTNDVWMWNGSKWVPTQITHPSEIDGVIGNEVSDTIANGFLSMSGAGTAASPKKLGLKPGINTGDVIMWDGTKWVSSYFGKNTLDDAYDEGGSGAGRIIIADAGSVQINGTDGLLVTGTHGSGVGPGTLGAGTRMIFNPRTSSFRAGRVTGTQWDGTNTGIYSFATGYNTLALGNSSIAMGIQSEAKAQSGIAIGDSSLANNQYSTAIGDHAKADGINSMAIGDNVWAYGQNSIVIGHNSYAPQAFSGIFGEESYVTGKYAYVMGYRDTAKGDYSTAIGYRAYAEGLGSIALGSYAHSNNPYSISIGYNVSAIADKSVALGSNVSTNFKNGSFIFGDNSTSTVSSSNTLNEMTMRFAGGYRIFSNSGLSTGVYMNGGTSGWTNYSDRNMKENFETIEGERILGSIKRLEITKWNYRNTDTGIKYIGPMAQDFYREFHLGGTDSLGINSVSMDGVNMAAIQALIYRTDKIQTIENQVSEYRARLAAQQAEIDLLKAQLEELRKLIIEQSQN